MFKGKTVLGLIPARGGSKGLPKKNIIELSGKPLIAWTIEKAQKSRYLDRVFVSTDSDEIARVAEKWGTPPPFYRPAEFAKDDSPSSEAIIHAIEMFESVGEHFDYVALLEPTSPLRTKRDIDAAITKLLTHDSADSLVSVGEVHTEHPVIVKKIDQSGFVKPYVVGPNRIFQRQQLDKAYFPYGVIYICKTDTYKRKKNFYLGKTIAHVIERWQSFEIDDAIDFLIVARILDEYIGEING